jgi:hypothetical protein
MTRPRPGRRARGRRPAIFRGFSRADLRFRERALRAGHDLILRESSKYPRRLQRQSKRRRITSIMNPEPQQLPAQAAT